MAAEIIMPQLGMNMTEGTVVEWRKREGDVCQRNEVIAVIQTDKADVELEAPSEGVLTAPLVRAGETVAVGTVIAYVLAPGEKEPDLAVSTLAPSPVVHGDQAIPSTPGARRLARTAGIS